MFVVNQNLLRICALKLRFVCRQTWVDSAFTQSEHKFAYLGLWFGGGWYLVRELNPGVCCAFGTVFSLSASSAFSCLSVCLSSSTSLSAPPPSLFIAERQSLVRRLPDCDADCKQKKKRDSFLRQQYVHNNDTTKWEKSTKCYWLQHLSGTFGSWTDPRAGKDSHSCREVFPSGSHFKWGDVTCECIFSSTRISLSR